MRNSFSSTLQRRGGGEGDGARLLTLRGWEVRRPSSPRKGRFPTARSVSTLHKGGEKKFPLMSLKLEKKGKGNVSYFGRFREKGVLREGAAP